MSYFDNKYIFGSAMSLFWLSAQYGMYQMFTWLIEIFC